MCSSVAAPFQLQADAFSCRDARDFNSGTLRIANVHAAFIFIGGCASSKSTTFRPRFAVANIGNHSYSWQALKTALPSLAAQSTTNFFRLSITDN
jgi:hypothetical protein